VSLRNGTDIFTGEDGRLESVGDYPAKIMGAHHAGLKLFLLPRESLAEAKEDEDMRVILIRSISEAWYLVWDDSSTQFTEMLFQSLSSA
jgi:PDZ domain-containing secreted protein